MNNKTKYQNRKENMRHALTDFGVGKGGGGVGKRNANVSLFHVHLIKLYSTEASSCHVIFFFYYLVVTRKKFS